MYATNPQKYIQINKRIQRIERKSIIIKMSEYDEIMMFSRILQCQMLLLLLIDFYSANTYDI